MRATGRALLRNAILKVVVLMFWSLLAGNCPADDGTRETRVQKDSGAGEGEGTGEGEGAREGEAGHGKDGDGKETARGRLQGNFP